MKKIVCGEDEKIYYGTVKKNGGLSKDRVEVTEDIVRAVIDHLLLSKKFSQENSAGYDVPLADGRVLYLGLFDTAKYKLTPINNAEEENLK